MEMRRKEAKKRHECKMEEIASGKKEKSAAMH